MTRTKTPRRPSSLVLKALNDHQLQEVIWIAADELMCRKLQGAKELGQAPFVMDEDGKLGNALLAACKA